MRPRGAFFSSFPAVLMGTVFVMSTVFVMGTALTAAAFAGTVSGKVVYDDEIPNLPTLDFSADPVCQEKHPEPVKSQVLVLGDDKELANVFVRVENPPSGDYPAPEEPVVIDQVGCLYQPHVAGAMVGQTVLFKNSDGILHNVRGLTEENPTFNIAMPQVIEERPQTFSEAEDLFKLKCDVHPWMNAYLAIMAHPFFDVTGKDGEFEIGDLPAGTYEIEAWHEKLGTRTETVEVGDGTAEVDFSFEVPKD